MINSMKMEEDPAFKRSPNIVVPPEQWTDRFGKPLSKDSLEHAKRISEALSRPPTLRKLKKRNADDPNEKEEWG